MASCVKIISILLLTLGSTRAAPSEPSQEFDIWKNPCESTSAKRHMRSTAERELYDFSNIVNGKKFKELRQLYPKHPEFKNNQIASTCPRINKILRLHKYTKNKLVGQKKFYLAMLDFYQYLEKLEYIQINTKTDLDLDKRRDLYRTTKNRLRLATCEFNETFHQNIGKKPRVPNMQCIPDATDTTGIPSFDIQFFKKLRRFLKIGKRLLMKWTGKHRRHGRVSVDEARTKINSS